jgi:hypothetical protein
MFNSQIIGWINYYGKFYKSEMYSTLRHINKALIMWARKKYAKSKSYCLNGSIEEVKGNPLHGINSVYSLKSIHFHYQESK